MRKVWYYIALALQLVGMGLAIPGEVIEELGDLIMEKIEKKDA